MRKFPNAYSNERGAREEGNDQNIMGRSKKGRKSKGGTSFASLKRAEEYGAVEGWN